MTEYLSRSSDTDGVNAYLSDATDSDNRKRVRLEVYVSLDPTPGAFHTERDAAQIVERILMERIGHYSPFVCDPL